MSALEASIRALEAWPGPVQEGLGVRLVTHCLYPSNSAVTVVLEGGVNKFRVHDAGGAVDEAEAAGVRLRHGPKSFAHLVRDQGLSISERGVIYSPQVEFAGVSAMIVIVANASKEVSQYLINQYKPPRRNMHDIIERLLDIEFHSRWHKAERVVGASNKAHRFDYFVRLKGDRQLLLDLVVPEPSSINAAVVSHIDVRHAKRPDIIQRIIYDDQAPWRAADLTLLRVGAPAVPISRAKEILDKLAA